MSSNQTTTQPVVSIFSQLTMVAIPLLLMAMVTTYLSFNSLTAQLKEAIAAQAAMISENIAPSLQFSDQQSADDILLSLSNNQDVLGAVLFNKNEMPFAGWLMQNNKTQPISTFNKPISIKYILSHYRISTRVLVANNHQGTLVIDYTLSGIYKRVAMLASGTLFAILLTLLIAWILLKRVESVQQKKQEIETVHRHTQDSIEYASLIQHALIPEETLLKQFFSDALCLWMPKDIVGGDIYTFTPLRHEDEAVLMVIDCTGHGVPGAFVTMLVKAIEQQIIATILHSEAQVSPSEILSIFNRTLKRMLKQETDESIHNAGFDGAVIYYNRRDKIIKFSGANTPLFYLQDNQLTFLKGDRHSVGYKRSKADFEFKEHLISVKEGDAFYISTDGFLDQSGGDNGFLFGKTRLSALLSNYQMLEMSEQKAQFVRTLKAYQGSETQNDDLTLIGFKI